MSSRSSVSVGTGSTAFARGAGLLGARESTPLLSRNGVFSPAYRQQEGGSTPLSGADELLRMQAERTNPTSRPRWRSCDEDRKIRGRRPQDDS
jgi:hypothetical protein